MTSEPSKGPWSVEEHVDKRSGEPFCWIILDAYGQEVAEINLVGIDIERPRTDARLIAAAPELLAACKMARDDKDFVMSVDVWERMRMRAAIAKAEEEVGDGEN